MTNLYPFGSTFKQLREKRGLSLKEAASTVVSPQFLSRFEKGEKGISLENFSRLLIVLGLEWKDFATAYANDGGDCMEFPAIEFSKHIVNEEDILRYMPEYEKIFETYLKDNPLQADILLKAIKLGHYPTIPKSEETVAKIQHIIHYLMELETYNSAELELYCRIVNHCPLELIEHMSKQLLFMYKQSADTDTYIRILNALTLTAKYFSEQGFYKKADDIIQKVKSLQTFERGYLSTPLMFLEVEHVYNQFRWNKPESIGLAKNLLNYLESAKFIDQNYYSNFIKAFTYHCHKLNKTGKDLF
ncbi:TPA: helix-turn-helix transcriptional regulator [Streptococcus suis]|uniref:helix-turn-helix domain-containing protein n=1 Tax=Streptococcus suis TaxID=1307 RepID=UPI001ABE9F5D|nr:helix-turn-helix transcriptional regulator [Streptococcus suis]MBO4109669.1 helix-turn-helix transcriptional regulator [Streptococcus suis]HEM3612961.1 helix-turn-helix transcriptional regulator [Streptococcus suis]HEM3615354.1 helix-turn-helix transcriptional regulator [Streptococcus suis]HEM3623319.1 helix-turn-helix transcriptional regulator [Streptococcus suis]HEM3627581.1 helix-turn-helix transcriptional regulator [Streptococcus suis]